MKLEWIPNRVEDLPELNNVETFTPQEHVDDECKKYLEKRVKRLEDMILEAQMYCRYGDARSAFVILTQALTGL